MLKDEDYVEAHLRYKNKKINPYERERCHALLLLSDGYTAEEVADILRVHEDSIRIWVKQYKERGLEGMKPEFWGGEHGQSQLGEEERKELDNILRKEAAPGGSVGSGWTLKQIIKVVEEKFNRKFGKSGMRKVLKKMGWSYQRARAKYIKKDPNACKEFEEEVKEKLSKYAESRKKVIPVAEDETKVRLEATIGYRWNPSGQQPEIADAGRRNQSVSIYGTIHLGTGEEFTIVTDWQDSDWTIKFLDEFQKTNQEGDILLFWDRARYHNKSQAVRDYREKNPRIVTIEFPAYSPEKNPKEPTWKVMREELTHNHWYDSLNDLIESMCDYYKRSERKVVNFLSKFGFTWIDGYIKPLPTSEILT